MSRDGGANVPGNARASMAGWTTRPGAHREAAAHRGHGSFWVRQVRDQELSP